MLLAESSDRGFCSGSRVAVRWCLDRARPCRTGRRRRGQPLRIHLQHLPSLLGQEEPVAQRELARKVAQQVRGDGVELRSQLVQIGVDQQLPEGGQVHQPLGVGKLVLAEPEEPRDPLEISRVSRVNRDSRPDRIGRIGRIASPKVGQPALESLPSGHQVDGIEPGRQRLRDIRGGESGSPHSSDDPGPPIIPPGAFDLGPSAQQVSRRVTVRSRLGDHRVDIDTGERGFFGRLVARLGYYFGERQSGEQRIFVQLTQVEPESLRPEVSRRVLMDQGAGSFFQSRHRIGEILGYHAADIRADPIPAGAPVRFGEGEPDLDAEPDRDTTGDLDGVDAGLQRIHGRFLCARKGKRLAELVRPCHRGTHVRDPAREEPLPAQVFGTEGCRIGGFPGPLYRIAAFQQVLGEPPRLRGSVRHGLRAGGRCVALQRLGGGSRLLGKRGPGRYLDPQRVGGDLDQRRCHRPHTAELLAGVHLASCSPRSGREFGQLEPKGSGHIVDETISPLLLVSYHASVLLAVPLPGVQQLSEVDPGRVRLQLGIPDRRRNGFGIDDIPEV